ncbi:DUF6036 family nucleotidyltransferase [Nocardioides plantarum]|uniref:DUF6036 family nucleotidyltransferase n=1 Tax=Nocardioides plantarum TaxID=29299 RepID=A0ABV5KHY4_9ACTN|nr:DUF6036 family nucleotidyltransferase [Nocardioides plantarum]
MDRQQLAHVLRAACDVSGDPEIVVLGSQAILGSFDEDELPVEILVSMEADLAWLADGPDRERAERVNGMIGELSQFEATNGYYPEGISVETAVLPNGWRDRLQGWPLQASHPARPLFIDRHDLVVAKLAANRPKDYVFVSSLAAHGLVDLEIIRDRVGELPAGTDARVAASILSFVDSLPATSQAHRSADRDDGTPTMSTQRHLEESAESLALPADRPAPRRRAPQSPDAPDGSRARGTGD